MPWRNKTMGKFDRYAFSAQPSFDEAETRKAFSKAVPLKTLVIYCYDPRAADIPNAVAKALGDEVFPGDIILDDSGNRVASSTGAAPSTRSGLLPSHNTYSGSRISSWFTIRTVARQVSRLMVLLTHTSGSTMSTFQPSIGEAVSA